MMAMPSSAEQPLLKICYEDFANPPYIYSEDNIAKGILADIITAAIKDVNVSVALYSKPWMRCQQDVISGEAHALFAMIQTDERKHLFAFPPEKELSQWYLWLAQYPVFKAKGKPFVAAEYQPNMGIGAPFGYVVLDMLNDKKWLSPYQYEPQAGLKMVAMNKLDGYVVERQIGIHLLEVINHTADVDVSEYLMLQSNWYLPFNKHFYKSHTALVENIWRNIAVQRKKVEDSLNEG
ncbi:hypothetical protein ATS75_04190 [Pseudoalteromonas sp. H105]|nr:hypothetical protein ATS75_04190 [Pseudoalteromonas sp. H105]